MFIFLMDGISAGSYVQISAGTFQIQAGGGSENGTKESSNSWGEFRGDGGPGGGGQAGNGQASGGTGGRSESRDDGSAEIASFLQKIFPQKANPQKVSHAGIILFCNYPQQSGDCFRRKLYPYGGNSFRGSGGRLNRYTRVQYPDACIGVLDPCGSCQMAMQACPLGSLLAGI